MDPDGPESIQQDRDTNWQQGLTVLVLVGVKRLSTAFVVAQQRHVVLLVDGTQSVSSLHSDVHNLTQRGSWS